MKNYNSESVFKRDTHTNPHLSGCSMIIKLQLGISSQFYIVTLTPEELKTFQPMNIMHKTFHSCTFNKNGSFSDIISRIYWCNSINFQKRQNILTVSNETTLYPIEYYMLHY